MTQIAYDRLTVELTPPTITVRRWHIGTETEGSTIVYSAEDAKRAIAYWHQNARAVPIQHRQAMEKALAELTQEPS